MKPLFFPRLRACGLLATGLSLATGPIAAQSVVAEEAAPPQKLDTFVVTGSYIPSTETAVEAGASPVTRLDRRSIDESGATTTAELLQKITVANANSVPVSNNATGFTPGATAISLRGLGPEATLVLINGRRVAPYPVGVGGSTAFVDLNSIPLAAIDSIEVLKDGASALYGADAVAGVVNIRLRRGIEGSEVRLSYGNTTDRDSAEVVVNAVRGAHSGTTSLMAGVNYHRKGAIANRDRDYSATPPFLSTNSSPFNLEVSRFAVAAAMGRPVSDPIPGVTANTGIFFAQSGADAGNDGSRPASQYLYSPDRRATYNPNEHSMSYPSSWRLGGFVFGERKLFGTDHVKAYGDLSYQRVEVENQLASSATGDFGASGRPDLVIPARTTNPILTVINPYIGALFHVLPGTRVPAGIVPGPGTRIVNGVVQRLAATGAYNPFNPFNQDIANGSRGRLAEFGNRIFRNRTDALLATAGARGENIAGRWNFDVSLSHSSIRDRSRNRMNSISRFNEITNAASPIFDPRSGAYIGTSTPYNPFGYHRVPVATNAAVAEYGRVIARGENESTLGQINAVVSTRELFSLRHGGVGLAFGGDAREERLSQHPDELGIAGDLIGSQPSAVTQARRQIGGAFLELKVPVFASLELGGAVRHERFFSSGREAMVPKLSLRWQPLARQLTLRSSYSEGFREPSLFELFSTPISALSSVLDPLSGRVESEMPITLRGNRRLEAERTDYFNAGFVWSPTTRRLKGLALGADFWAVTRKGTVEANPQNTVWRAFGLAPGGLQPGEAVHFGSSGAISLVDVVFYNVGQTRVEGWDFSGGYRLPTDRLGLWELSTVWTYVTRFDRASVHGAALRDVRGQDSSGVGADGYLKWKGRVNLNWAYRGYGVHLGGAYTDGFTDTLPGGTPRQVRDRFIVDGQVSYSFPGRRHWAVRDTRVSAGMRNLFDWDPPQAYGGGANTTGYPGHLYTSEGRFWYVSVSRKL